MWFLVSLCVLALGCALAGRKWGRWFYLRYGRFILPRVLLPAKNRVPTPPLSPALKNDENLEGSLDETGEMHNTDDQIIDLKDALNPLRRISDAKSLADMSDKIVTSGSMSLVNIVNYFKLSEVIQVYGLCR
uniref:Uncharacterized protein n=1 Tax=Glossina palpalis gambiensis TaxID=67801 RepID=A0A1B0BMQ9_9MUSC